MNLLKKTAFVLTAMLLTLNGSAQKGVNQLTKKEKKKGWTLLFDGKTANRWVKAGTDVFPAQGWSIADGCITLVEGTKPGDIVTVEEYFDFDLMVDFKIDSTCNSGIKYFYAKYEKGGYLGMEYQVLDDKFAADNKLENHSCGSLYDMIAADKSQKKIKPWSKWNTARIIAKGKHVEQWLNGKKVVEYDRGSDVYMAALAKSKYKDAVPTFGMVEKGKILLQDHGHKVSFRNIKIRKL
jgi:hypothetical protein